VTKTTLIKLAIVQSPADDARSSMYRIRPVEEAIQYATAKVEEKLRRHLERDQLCTVLVASKTEP
jgi:hypothetical protein